MWGLSCSGFRVPDCSEHVEVTGAGVRSTSVCFRLPRTVLVSWLNPAGCAVML